MLHSTRPPRASSQAENEVTDEELIPDPRGALTPREFVERKLAALLKDAGFGISDMRANRRSSRGHGPAPGPKG
jgi:hypothetical protein